MLIGDVPSGVVTVTSKVPAALDGTLVVIDVPAPFGVKRVDGAEPNRTDVAPVKFFPEMVTVDDVFTLGLTCVTIGTFGAMGRT
jgi:hypothetical protein